ncbi:hypothetical protein DFQ28_007272 [Apophysomyces sp. BC1034]|nr:hypothetical protein DFQ30_006983 [Apophysomyces sp. BC1015]KAG0176438.1 hypothetical protein DFQ29_006107 [Apophysomyces sp. BC1021]KAG0186810.1 hypothetical protein DFQ28_007272 [Apophysomyces sp. BC1034]
MTTSSSVRVAVRVRPQTEQEKQHSGNAIISFVPNQPQIVVGNDRSFTFDYAYPPTSDQEEVYDTCVVPLLNKFIEGQTGSGKTYSMGIGLESALNATNEGIVPRFIHSLFDHLHAKSSPDYTFQVSVSFLELHNEDLVDLLSKREGLNLSIREDSHGNICWHGVREEVVTQPTELLEYLQRGSNARKTASTDMNHTSSRSHAIFSVMLKQTKDSKKLVSKFHFVDLAGSERLKRTNAVGDRAKEGISINSGLLALGNVISALGDESRRVSHIPYRDSKLTRLLQDSLGGNSQTLMLACASPAEANYTETLNTLKYANRARNIRNRVTVNQEVGEGERFKAQIMKLKEEIRGNDEYVRAVNSEMDQLKNEVENLNRTLFQMTDELATIKCERDVLKCQSNVTISEEDDDHGMLRQYARTIEQLRIELQQLKQSQQQPLLQRQAILPPSPAPSPVRTLVNGDDSCSLIESTMNKEHAEISPERKKKKHSYRFGSKRSQRGRRRPGVSASKQMPKFEKQMPKFEKQMPKFEQLNSKKLDIGRAIQQAKASLCGDLEFLHSCQSSLSSNHWTIETDDLSRDPHVMQFADSFPVNDTFHIADNRPLRKGRTEHHTVDIHKILQRLQGTIDSKHRLIQVLEHANQHQKDQAVANVKLANEHKRALADVELRCKKQQTELQNLKRKHQQLSSHAESVRAQSSSMILTLKQKVERMTHEKKKLMKRIKQEGDRARERCSGYEREIQKYRRQETQQSAARKRAEREIMMQKAAAKRSSEDIVALSSQMKQVVTILKKMLQKNCKIDRNLLAKAVACASVRGYLVKQNRSTVKPASVQQRVFQKKKIIHRAISIHVKGLVPNKEIEECIQKRDRLLREQQELLSERRLVLQDEAVADPSVPQYMDERIDTITAQIGALDYQIECLQQPHVNNDEWTDVESKDFPINDTQVAYEIALSMIRSLEPEEIRVVSEVLMEDIVRLQFQNHIQTIFAQHMTATVQSLQSGMIQMRRLGRSHDAISFDTLFGQYIQGSVKMMHGLVLPETKEVPTVRPPSRKQKQQNQRSALPTLRCPSPRGDTKNQMTKVISLQSN